MKSILLLAALLCLAPSVVFAQKDCSKDSSGLIPLIDLQGKSWQGYMGGLYPDGTNSRPQAHKNKALQQAQSIKPLDATGAPSSNGKIVWIGVGASNPRTEFLRFMEQMETFALKNPSLKLINTCIGGQGIQKMNSPTDNYWKQAEKQLADSSLTNKQVQVAWVETDNTQTADTSFPRAPQMLADEFRTLLVTLKQLYPNLKICYLSARAYSGYASPEAGATVGKGLLFPRDYLNGWAIKWLIEKQINGEAGYEYDGATAPLPLATWGTYNWADGSVKRSDGLQWLCDLDIGGDGLHLSAAGEIKSGKMMYDYFTQDETTQPWIVKQSTSVEDEPIRTSSTASIYPNPANTELTIRIGGSSTEARIINMLGQTLWTGVIDGAVHITTDSWSPGMYMVMMGSERVSISICR